MAAWRRMVAGFAAALVGTSIAVTMPGGSAVADEIRDQQWMIDELNLLEAWQTSKGAGVTVGIVDSGVDATHPDLEGNVLPGIGVLESSGPDDDGLTDEEGHGTAIASLIAGHGHGEGNKDGVMGIAPEAKILSVRGITGEREEGEFPEKTDTAKGIRWLADNGADIIALAYTHGIDSQEEAAIQYATGERGIPVVAGAGNTVKGGPVEHPAAYPETIAVTGTIPGGGFWTGSAWGAEVTMSAPAENITAAWTDHGYDTADGTSNSTGIVAGALALLKAEYPDASRMELIWRITELTTDGGNEGPDSKFGYGIVNPVEALTKDPGPLPEEMADPMPTGTYTEPASESAAAGLTFSGKDSDGIPLWLWVSIAAALLVVAATTLVTLRRRRSRTITEPPTSNAAV